MRMRKPLAVAVAVLAIAPLWRVPTARAAAETHRFNLVLSAVPTKIRAGDFNDLIDYTNRTQLEARGLAPLDKIKDTWLLDVQGYYFLRQNFAINAGVGRIRKQTFREYLPALATSIIIRASITSVPLHVGGAYYFKPYNQGDFQARAYVGAGFLSVVYNRASLGVTAQGINIDPAAAGSIAGTNDGPGYYGEVGAHMFFASRYSALLGIIYRSSEIHNLVDERSGALIHDAQGRPIALDVGGVGVRMALGVGL